MPLCTRRLGGDRRHKVASYKKDVLKFSAKICEADLVSVVRFADAEEKWYSIDN